MIYVLIYKNLEYLILLVKNLVYIKKANSLLLIIIENKK